MDYLEVLESINQKHSRNSSRRINEIIREFKKGVNKFKYSGDSVGLSLLLDEIIIYRRITTKKERATIDKRISSIIAQIEDIFSNKPDYIKNDDPNYLEIKKIHNSLSELGLIQSKRRLKDSNQMYKLLRFVVFNSRDLGLIKRMINDYPDVVNSVSADDTSIAEEICKKYMEELAEFKNTNSIKNRNNLLFLDEILNLLLVSSESKYILTPEVQQKCLIIVDRAISKDYDTHVKDYMVWVNRIVDNIMQRDSKISEEDMELATDIHRDFSYDVTFIVKNGLLNSYFEEVEKRDHNDECIITIDGEGAVVLDDGLSAKKLSNGNFLLGVHISDPMSFLGPYKELIDEAFKRTRTVYGGRKPIYIYPKEVYDLASLREDKKNLTLSYYLEIDQDGNVMLDHFRIKKEVVDITQHLTFHGADELITSSTYSTDIDSTVSTLVDIYNILRKRFDTTEDVEDELLSPEENESSSLVQYSMMLTNMTTANYMFKNGLTFLYIANGQREAYFNNLGKISPESLPDKDTRGIYKQLSNNPGRSFYTTNPNQVHQALGGIHYSRVTSPLILFGDSLATLALHAFYFGEVDQEQQSEYEDNMREMAKYMNHRVKTIEYVNRNYSRVNKE